MDFNALQHKLFALDPTDPREDLKKLAAQAGQVQESMVPAANYLQESVEVPEGTLQMDRDYSVSDFAKLAGVQIDEAPQGFMSGFNQYNKIDPWLGGASGGKSEPAPKTKAPAPTGEKPTPAPQGGQKPTPAPAPKPTSDWPTSKEGHTLAVGDLVTYTNQKGQLRKDVPVVALLKDKKDGKGRPQIQLELRGATYAISREQIAAVNGKKFTLVDAEEGKGKIEALEARVAYLESVIKTLLEGKNDAPVKARDPNWRDMEAIRKSGASGAHKDKKKDMKAGKMKHKGQSFESIKDMLYAKLAEKK